MVKKILVAVDGSDNNKVAVDLALEYAKSFGASVTAISVFDIGNYSSISNPISYAAEKEIVQEIGESSLEYVRSKAKENGIELETVFITGRPAEKIVEQSKDFDLVICGTMGRTGIKRALIGSVAETVVRLASCPVLVVREQNSS